MFWVQICSRQRTRVAERRLAEMNAKFADARGAVVLDKMTEQEQTEYVKLVAEVNQLRSWKDAKIPDQLDLKRLAPVPETLTSKIEPPSTASLEIAAAGSWRFMGLLTETMVPVPKDWEIYEAGYDSVVLFPVVQMAPGGPKIKPDKRELIQIKFSVREAKDFDAHYEILSKQIKAAIGAGVTIGPKNALPGGAGFTMYQSDQVVSILVFVPAKDHPGMGYQCLATTTPEKWKSLAPVYESMITHWYARSGTRLAPDFKCPPLTPTATQPTTMSRP